MTVVCADCSKPTDSTDECTECGADPFLADRYRLDEPIGQGASGITYRATDTEADRTVAIKEMGIHGIDSLKAHELFEREADVLCRLDHPGIPTFYDYFETGEGKSLRFYLVMEFVDGHTLVEELDHRQYSDAEIEQLIRDLAEIAEYLHELNPPVIHRDIKPSNVMRAADGRLVLIDFGSVRDVLEPNDRGSTIAGTIGYMAPEQLRGAATTASDVYGIGATALHMCTRKDPEQLLGPTNILEFEDHIDLPGHLERVVEGMLEPDPDERLTDGEAILESLERPEPSTPDDQTSTATPDAEPRPVPSNQLPRQPNQHDSSDSSGGVGQLARLLGGTAAVAIGVMICGGTLFVGGGDSSPPPTSIETEVADPGQPTPAFDPADDRRGEEPSFGLMPGVDEDGNPELVEDLENDELKEVFDEIKYPLADGPAREPSLPDDQIHDDSVHSVLEDAADEFAECVDDDGAGHRADLTLEVEDRRVEAADLQAPDLPFESRRCIKGAAANLEFPDVEHPRTIEVPLRFN